MTPPTLSAPPRPRAEPSVAPPPLPPRKPERRAAPSYERILRWALVLSVAAHLLVLLVSPIFLRIGLPPGETDTSPERTAPFGMRIIEPVVVADAPTQAVPAETEIADVPAPAPDPRLPTRPAVPGARAPEAAPGPRGAAPSDPLRPGARDPRLWVTPRELPPPPEPTQEELHQQYMRHLQARLDALNDSIAGDAERARRATDWTVKDSSGRRWGVSPEGIHLGGTTLPPVQLQGDRDQELAAREKERQRQEIIRQAEDAERRRVREESTRATRERRDAERRPPPD